MFHEEYCTGIVILREVLFCSPKQSCAILQDMPSIANVGISTSILFERHQKMGHIYVKLGDEA